MRASARLAPIVLMLASFLMFPACVTTRATIDVTHLNPPFRVETYERGAIAAEHAIAPGSEEEQAIIRWLRAHESGWRSDLNTYASKRRILGERFQLNFAGQTCVLNYDRTGQGDWVQVSRTLPDSEDRP